MSDFTLSLNRVRKTFQRKWKKCWRTDRRNGKKKWKHSVLQSNKSSCIISMSRQGCYPFYTNSPCDAVDSSSQGSPWSLASLCISVWRTYFGKPRAHAFFTNTKEPYMKTDESVVSYLGLGTVKSITITVYNRNSIRCSEELKDD